MKPNDHNERISNSINKKIDEVIHGLNKVKAIEILTGSKKETPIL